MVNNVFLPGQSEEVKLSSRRKWFWLGLIIALLNPFFSGLVIGFGFWTEPLLKKEGKIILVVSVIWGLLFFYLSQWLFEQGYLPF